MTNEQSIYLFFFCLFVFCGTVITGAIAFEIRQKMAGKKWHPHAIMVFSLILGVCIVMAIDAGTNVQ